MKAIQTIALALLAGLFSGCGMWKAAKYIKSGSVSRAAFKTEVPFEMRYGLIVLKVMIRGREHSFLLDTGAPDVISKELAALLGLKVAGKGHVSDSQGGTGTLGYALVDSLGIGGLQFLKTGAVIADLKQNTEIGCLDVDGFIGANLMRKAVWQFDYERHVITITSDRDSLLAPPGAQAVKFNPSRVGTPMIDVQLNGETDHNVTVDLGSTGDFVSSVETLKLLRENGLGTHTYSYGVGATGLYGKGEEDTTWYAVIHSIGLDSLKLGDQVVSFSKKAVKTAGTNFFKNYRLIFDWTRNELTMIPVRPYDNTSRKIYCFNSVLRDHHVYVGSLFSTRDVAADGPQLGDQVLEIDGKDYRNCSGERWCELLRERAENPSPSVSLLVRRGDKELNFRVEKEAIFQTP